MGGNFGSNINNDPSSYVGINFGSNINMQMILSDINNNTSAISAQATKDIYIENLDQKKSGIKNDWKYTHDNRDMSYCSRIQLKKHINHFHLAHYKRWLQGRNS